MNKENNTIKKGKRRIAVVMASIMALTLILSATFAWYSTVNAENIFKNQSGDKSVVLHDDFEGGPIKRVYVENTSETSDIFVRIMLQEFMDLTSYTPRPLYANDFTTHTPDTFVHDCGLSNKFLELFHPNFTWVMGGQTWYLPCPQGENGTVNDLNDYSGDPNAKQTLDATVISMAVYNMKSPAEKQSFVGWVYDIDGWAYWSQPLAAQTATGLLLSAVNPHSNVQSLDYYYVINVLMEAVDRMDLPMWTVTSGNNDGKGQESVLGTGETSQLGSPDAIDMLNGISKPKSSVASIAVTTEPDKLTYAPDETFDPTGMVITVTYTDGTTEEITSGFAYSPKGALKDTDTEITISYGGATCKQQITISSLSGVEDLGIYDTFTVDGVSWTVINKQTISDRDYVLITTTNSVDTTRPLHNYWDEYQYEGSLIQSRMTEFFTDTLMKGSLASYIVIPEHKSNPNNGDIYADPTGVLAKDDPGITKDVAFALSITDVKYAQSFTGSNLVSSSDSWLRTSHGPEAFDTWRANGSLWYGTYDDTNIGYRPAVWVQLP